MNSVLITGGLGFLGSYLCEEFLERGYRVFCYDNLVTGQNRNLDRLAGQERFHFVNQDVTEYIDLEAQDDFSPEDGLEYVLHFASPASPDDYRSHPIKTLKVGSLGTHNTLGVAKRYGARYLLASTSEVYGDPEVHPQPESYNGNVNQLGDRGVYDEAKRFSEAITMAYRRKHDVDTAIARIFNTYGPRMRIDDGRVVPNFLSQAIRGEPLTVYGDGQQTRSFCFVSDLIDGLVKLADSDLSDPVNLGNDDEVSILDFAELVLEVTGSDSDLEFHPLPEDDPEVRRPDLTRARTTLGWQPSVELREGLTRTVPYFESVLTPA